MSFSIAAPEVKVGAIELRGVSPEMAAKIKRVADHVTGTPYPTENSTANVEHAFSSFFADEGYAAVKVHAARAGELAMDAAEVKVPFAVGRFSMELVR